MKILVSYRGAPRIRGYETGAMLAKAFRSLGHEVDEYAKIYERPEWVALRDVFSNEYDLQVYMECNDGEPQYAELKHITTKRRVGWLFDIDMTPDYYLQLADYMKFDHCYVANTDFVNGNFACSASYLPYAADMELFGRPLDTPKWIDVCLVGSDRPERRELIKNLNKNGIGAELICDVFKKDYFNVLAGSKIVVNDVAGGGANLLSMRAFEAPAAGAMLLQAATPALKDVFEVGVCCEAFHDQESLVALAKHYIENDEQRKLVAANGQYWVANHHTYVNRAQKILNDC